MGKLFYINISAHNKTASKLKQHVEFPMKNLDMSPFMVDTPAAVVGGKKRSKKEMQKEAKDIKKERENRFVYPFPSHSKNNVYSLTSHEFTRNSK